MTKAIFVRRGFHQFQPSRQQPRPWKPIVVLAFILLLVVGLMPVPSSRLEKRLQESFQEAFGGAASFSSCSIRIRDFRLYTDETQQQLLLECSRVRVGYNPVFYPLTGAYGLYLSKPRLIVPNAVDGQFQTPKSLSNAFKGDSEGTSNVPSFIRVDDARIEYTCMVTSVPVLGEDIDIAITRLRSEKPKALECRGRALWAGQGLSFTSEGTVNLLEKSASLSGIIRPATGTEISVNLLGYKTAGEVVSSATEQGAGEDKDSVPTGANRTQFSAKSVPWTLNASILESLLSLDVALTPQEGFLTLSETLKPSLKQGTGRFKYDRAMGKFSVEDFTISLDNYHATANGEFGLTGYKPFRLKFSSQDMPSEVIRTLLAQRQPELPFVLVSGILGFQIESSGLMTNPAGTFSQGRLDCQGCTFEHVATGFRITSVSGGIDFSPEEAVFRQLEARYTDRKFSIDGSVRGDPYIWDDPVVDVKAQGEIDLMQTGKFIHALIPAFVGDTKISGNALLDIAATGRVSDPNSLTFDGSVDLQNVSVSGGLFPVPFNHVSGQVVFRDNTMTLNDLQASTGKTTVALQGTYKRGEQSWREGTVDLKLVGVAEAEEIFPVLQRSMPKYLEGYRVAGPLEYNLSVSGLLSSTAERTWSGNAL
ncbi:MAG TPA: DUF3971 domain-containing protein, partial [bacterium]|nr:DUF3971 domain-containing protein [bacterium]